MLLSLNDLLESCETEDGNLENMMTLSVKDIKQATRG